MAGSAAPTRAAQFCSGFLEAGWLAALVVVPLYYNPFSAGMFDYDKTAVLRALSLLMLAAWLALQAMRRTRLPAWDRLRTTPLLAPVALLILATMVSTAFSIDARLSFFGSLSRNNGTYSLLALLVVALAVATELRQHAQRQRLVGATRPASQEQRQRQRAQRSRCPCSCSRPSHAELVPSLSVDCTVSLCGAPLPRMGTGPWRGGASRRGTGRP